MAPGMLAHLHILQALTHVETTKRENLEVKISACWLSRLVHPLNQSLKFLITSLSIFYYRPFHKGFENGPSPSGALIQQMMWQRGARSLILHGPPKLCKFLQECYSAGSGNVLTPFDSELVIRLKGNLQCLMSMLSMYLLWL